MTALGRRAFRVPGACSPARSRLGTARAQKSKALPRPAVCRRLGVSEAKFYVWKKKYAHLGVSELRRLRSLMNENARPKRLVTDLSLDEHVVTAALRKTV